MPKYRHQCDPHIHPHTKTDPRYGHVENRMVDIVKEHSEAREEEKKREV
jgi:hypothetical protein